MQFVDRSEAGRKIASKLSEYKKDSNTIVLALPRGGVIVAYEIAQALSLPLDVMVVRKLGVPGNEEFAMGAISSGGGLVLHQDAITLLNISAEAIAQVRQHEELELQRREQRYRKDKPPLNCQGKKVILVDDGIATGATMEAAILSLRKQQVSELILAVPVAPASSLQHLNPLVDKSICLYVPEPFWSVSSHYQHFPQNSDEEVCILLQQFNNPGAKDKS